MDITKVREITGKLSTAYENYQVAKERRGGVQQAEIALYNIVFSNIKDVIAILKDYESMSDELATADDEYAELSRQLAELKGGKKVVQKKNNN